MGAYKCYEGNETVIILAGKTEMEPLLLWEVVASIMTAAICLSI